MGGRIAEETTFGQITTGAQNDIEQATEMARKMVCEWGMSEALGPLTYGKKEEAIFLGKEFNRHQDYSEATALKIDAEIKRIVIGAVRAGDAAPHREPRRSCVRVAEALLEHEVLDAPQLKQLIAGEPLEVKAAPRRRRAAARREVAGRGERAVRRASCRRRWRTRGRRPRGSAEAAIETRGRRLYRIPLRGAPVVLGERTLVMGILNVTPDSFSDGGRARRRRTRRSRAACALFEEGADWVDVGGESTRPGAARGRGRGGDPPRRRP